MNDELKNVCQIEHSHHRSFCDFAVNLVAESFFKTLKSEIIYGFGLLSSERLRDHLFAWIECWYNKNRRHAALRNLTIDEFYEKLNTKNNSTNFPNLLCG